MNFLVRIPKIAKRIFALEFFGLFEVLWVLVYYRGADVKILFYVE